MDENPYKAPAQFDLSWSKPLFSPEQVIETVALGCFIAAVRLTTMYFSITNRWVYSTCIPLIIASPILVYLRKRWKAYLRNLPQDQ
jgi:hypothetical protein